MPENPQKPDIDTSRQSKRWRPSQAMRHILMVIAGFIALVAVSSVVLYHTVLYGDAIENFGIVMMLTVPVIAAVAFRVALDTWLDRE
ncbi:hypothetical protein [Caballeronia sp. dw_276]|jgi:hypothetical protein|uniref:hypothetical protein n=1 Tax=Caballeronia sp. dw_276 TaxID=2719795 RepID=UPI001BD24E9E|nr:hypothetical protein [Caballeronia sp. dw_276]